MQFNLSKDGKRAELFGRAKFSATTTEGKRVVEGLAIVYGQLSDDRGGYQVRIAPGAATYASPLPAILNHNVDLLIGNTDNGTLDFVEQADGIYCRIVLPDNVDGDKAWSWVKDGYATGMSFGCIPNEWVDEVVEGVKIRTYTDMLVYEYSIVHSPAFVNAYVAPAEPEAVEAPADEPATVDYSEMRKAQLELVAMRIEGLRKNRP